LNEACFIEMQEFDTDAAAFWTIFAPAKSAPSGEVCERSLCEGKRHSGSTQGRVRRRVSPVEQSLLIDCRPTEISQVLLNLLNNAVDTVQPSPEKWVEVRVTNVAADVEISVMDSGKGIAKQFRDKVGQPFFTTKQVGHRTGLGLSISKGIAEAHGGHLNLDAECEHTRFVATLPKAVAVEKEDAVSQ